MFKYPWFRSSFLIIAAGHDITYQLIYYKYTVVKKIARNGGKCNANTSVKLGQNWAGQKKWAPLGMA
jgi:hypothetical protein